ncbi:MULTISPECIES: hypothetical protein [Streptomyces]|jgi:hypothetical protein|nr:MULTISPECIES: hypothetical protein [unclassified Streptomyces]MDX2730391.1 hypothetical protein [Streptomyces sp. PA03-2a]MDX3769077.1 hypothetical protein [Streptomyces sp. AK08-01B]MDX3815519.1 hypothetical protein [Streptomyces sp. AK08-01A]SCX96568.1 hypothetical protein SAMN02745898_101407 [Streptomyces sp. 136MFCol5.1]SFS40932.1 hypothetical protein SAMN04487982_101456 [Streptomyces sp. ok210]
MASDLLGEAAFQKSWTKQPKAMVTAPTATDTLFSGIDIFTGIL